MFFEFFMYRNSDITLKHFFLERAKFGPENLLNSKKNVSLHPSFKNKNNCTKRISKIKFWIK